MALRLHLVHVQRFVPGLIRGCRHTRRTPHFTMPCVTQPSYIKCSLRAFHILRHGVKYSHAKCLRTKSSLREVKYGAFGYCALVPTALCFSHSVMHTFLRTAECETLHHAKSSQELITSLPLYEQKYHRQHRRNFIIRWIQSVWNFIRYTGRCLHIACVFTPLVCAYPFFAFNTHTRHTWWCLVRASLEHLGPTFVKLGQWAATRKDIFSTELCAVFARLHNSTHSHSWTLTKKKLRQAFGHKWRDLFVYIDKKPVGSGCIAQVYRAYMRSDAIPDNFVLENDDDPSEIDFIDGLEILGFNALLDQISSFWEGTVVHGQTTDQYTLGGSPLPPEVAQCLSEQDIIDNVELIPVAVKVLHPAIYRRVSRDLHILRNLSIFGEYLIPSLKWISLSQCVSEFERVLVRQIDLRFEAECLERFRYNFRDTPSVHFPQPIKPYCCRDVLVETFETGLPISEFIKRDDSSSETKATLAVYSINALLEMIFHHNLVHGDLHPGNIFVQHIESSQEDGCRLMETDLFDTVVVTVQDKVSPQLRLVILDVGIAASLAENDLKNFKDVFTAVCLDQGEKIAQMMLDKSSYHECTDLTGYRKEMGELVHMFRKDKLSLNKVHVADLLQQVFGIMTKYKVMMDHAFASILLSIFVLEGLGRSLDPNLDLLAHAAPLLLGS